MSNRSPPQDGTAGFGRAYHSTIDSNADTTTDRNTSDEEYDTPISSPMHTSGNMDNFVGGYHHPDAVSQAGGPVESGLEFENGDFEALMDMGLGEFVSMGVREPDEMVLGPVGNADNTSLESRIEWQGSQHSLPWDPLTAQGFPVDQANSQAAGYPTLLPSNNPMPPSQANNSIRSTHCEPCGSTLGTTREWHRHMQTVHSAAKYMCKCLYSAARKDNYIRHLTKSCKAKEDAGSLFCICGKEDSNFDEHLAHVKVCGKQRAGRRALRRP